jgi:hypothetical protein
MLTGTLARMTVVLADAEPATLSLAVYAIAAALVVPLGIIALRAGSSRPLVVPAGFFVLGLAMPQFGAKVVLVACSVIAVFVVAIVARFRRTGSEERRLLADNGLTPWPAKSRAMSGMLLYVGTILMAAGIAIEQSSGHRSIASVLLYPVGATLQGFGLIRSHAVLVGYFGRRRGRLLEAVQVLALVCAYALALTAELSSDLSTRETLRALTFVPFGTHYLLVWQPLENAASRLEASRLNDILNAPTPNQT